MLNRWECSSTREGKVGYVDVINPLLQLHWLHSHFYLLWFGDACLSQSRNYILSQSWQEHCRTSLYTARKEHTLHALSQFRMTFCFWPHPIDFLWAISPDLCHSVVQVSSLVKVLILEWMTIWSDSMCCAQYGGAGPCKLVWGLWGRKRSRPADCQKTIAR